MVWRGQKMLIQCLLYLYQIGSVQVKVFFCKIRRFLCYFEAFFLRTWAEPRLHPENTDLAACKGPKPLTEGVGQALARLEVTGNYCEPKVTTTALPVIRETLGILGTRSATQHQ